MKPVTRKIHRRRLASIVGTCLFATCAAIVALPAAASAPWQDKAVVDGIVYFAMPDPPRVERFDMAQQNWLTAISTMEPAGRIAVGAGFLVTLEQNRIRRYPLGGGGSTLLAEFDAPAELLIRDGFVILRYGSWHTMSLVTLNLTTGNPIATLNLGLETPSGLAMPRDQRRLYGVTDGLFPGRLVAVDFNASGQFLGHEFGPFADLSPRPVQHYAAPDGSAILTSGGQIVDGSSLASGLGTGGPVSDAIIEDDFALILREQSLMRLDAQFREMGVWPLDQGHDGVAAHAGTAFVFRDSGTDRPSVSTRPLLSIVPLDPSLPPDPRDQQWLADEVELDDLGILHLHDRARSAVHRFAMGERRFVDSLALNPDTVEVAVVPETGATFAAGEGGRLAHAEADERRTRFVAFLPAEIRLMAAAGQWVHVDVESEYSSTNHHLFNDSGQRLAVLDNQNRTLAMRWCPQTRRVYHAPAFVSPNNLRWVEYSEQGDILDQGMLFHNLSYLIDGPIRPSPDGARLSVGSGQVFDVQSTLELSRLPGPFIDMAWLGNELYTLRMEKDQSLVERWSEDLELLESGVLFGASQRLLAMEDRLLSVTTGQGRTWIHQISPDLDVPNVSTWVHATLPEFTPGQEIAAVAYFFHDGASTSVPAELSVELDTAAFDTLAWQCESSSGPFECGQDGVVSESLQLEPGDWVRVDVSGSVAPNWTGPITLSAEIIPASPDFDPADNLAEHVWILVDSLFSDRFESVGESLP